MKNRNPGYPRQSDQPLKKAMTQFLGMLTGEPASELPSGYSAYNKNVIDRGEYYEVRNGSRLYSSLRFGYDATFSLSTTVFLTSTVHNWQTGDSVFFQGEDLPSPLAENTEYFIIKVNVNTFRVATSYSNAIAGTAITISTIGSGFKVYYGEINGYYDHVESGKLVFVLGSSVYVADKELRSLTRVANTSEVRPSGVCMISSLDTDAVIFSDSGIFKVFLEGPYYYVDLINKPVPSVLITDINQVAPDTIYGYLYLYSIALLSEAGNSNRLTAQILSESGTCQNESVKDYGECFFTSPVGENLANTHIIGTLTLPNAVNNITHFPLYRTRNIGELSGGAGTDVSSEGNRRDLFVWTADIPVAKVFMVDSTTVAADGRIKIAGAATNKFTINDIGSVLRPFEGYNYTISGFISENEVSVVLTSGSWVVGSSVEVSIGGGRTSFATQSGDSFTSYESLFVVSDVGKLIFLSDGSTRRVKKYVSGTNVLVVEEIDIASNAAAFTIKPVSGNFTRKWNDTTPDDSQGDGRVSLSDTYLLANEGSDQYVPRRFAIPIPNGNVGVIENGYMICSKRGEGKYYYSQIGDKPYTIGYYNPPIQTRKINGAISYMVVFPSKVIILSYDKTFILFLNSATNSGRTSVGEVVMELPTAECIDAKRGVRAWQTVKFKNQNLMFALTNDSAMRYFDGTSWSVEDLALSNGYDAVSKKFLKKADQSVSINSFYSNNAGLKLWFRKWDELENTSTATYRAIQLTINDSDTNIQGSIDTRSERGSGINDQETMVI